MGFLEKIFGKAKLTKQAKCFLCNNQFEDNELRLLVKRTDAKDIHFVFFDDSERLSMDALKILGYRIETLDDLRQDIKICDKCFSSRISPIIDTSIKNTFLEIEKSIRKGHEFSAETQDGIIHGAGRLGATRALPLFTKLYQLAKDKGIDTGRLHFGIVDIAASYLKQGIRQSKEFTKEELTVISECLIREVGDISTSMWIELMASLLENGIQLQSVDRLSKCIEKRRQEIELRMPKLLNHLPSAQVLQRIKRATTENDHVLELLRGNIEL